MIGFIPWNLFYLPANDKLGHRFFYLITALNVILLALFSTTLNLGRLYYFTTTTEVITFTNFIILIEFILLTVSFILLGSVNISINLLSHQPEPAVITNNTDSPLLFNSGPWVNSIIRLTRPLRVKYADQAAQLKFMDEELSSVNTELNKDRHQLNLLTLLNDLEILLKPILDPPVVAQLTANAIQRSLNVDLVTVFTYDYPRHEFVSMASAGKIPGLVPPEYRQPTQKGLIGRAARLKKLQYVPDTRLDSDFIPLNDQQFYSEAAIPLLHQGLIKGMMVVDSGKVNAFNILDIEAFESIGAMVLSSWNRSSYDDRLKELIRAGINLTTTLETDVVIQEIASMVQQTLAARFVFVALMDQLRVFNRTAMAGYAPKLINFLTLNPETNIVIQTVVNALHVHRMHDIRKLEPAINLDNINLRGFLGFPLKMRGQKIGAILAFGKQGGVYFSEEDEFLATLISNQATASIEMTWLYQQLSTAFNTTTRLYDLSNAILKTESSRRCCRVSR